MKTKDTLKERADKLIIKLIKARMKRLRQAVAELKRR